MVYTPNPSICNAKAEGLPHGEGQPGLRGLSLKTPIIHISLYVNTYFKYFPPIWANNVPTNSHKLSNNNNNNKITQQQSRHEKPSVELVRVAEGLPNIIGYFCYPWLPLVSRR